MIGKTFIEKLGAYEEGRMNEPEMVEFFQELIDKDVVWKLQGHYGRVAELLLDLGMVQPKNRLKIDVVSGETDLFCNKVKKDLTSDNK